MRDCGRIYLTTCVLVFFTTSDVSSKTSGIPSFRKVTKAASPFMDRRDAFQMPQGEMFSPATVHVERKLYRQLLRKLSRRAMGAFLSFSFFIFFHCDRHGALRDSTAVRQTRVKERLETWIHRALLNFSTDLLEPCEGTNRPSFHVKFLVSLMHLKANNAYVGYTKERENFFYFYFNLPKKFLSPH